MQSSSRAPVLSATRRRDSCWITGHPPCRSRSMPAKSKQRKDAGSVRSRRLRARLRTRRCAALQPRSECEIRRWGSPLKLDLDVDAGRKVEAHQRVDRLRSRRVDVDQPLVRAHLEVLPRILVLERRPDHAVDVLLGGQGHRPGDGGAGSLSRLDDRLSRLVELLVVVALESDADLLSHLGEPAPSYLTMSVTTPAPTVRPASRTAKRRP